MPLNGQKMRLMKLMPLVPSLLSFSLKLSSFFSSRTGGKKSQPYLAETAEVSEKRQQKAERKEFNRATFGWEAFTVEAGYKSYSKKLGLLSPSSPPSLCSSDRLPPPPPTLHESTSSSSGDVTSSSLTKNPLQYGRVGTAISEIGLNRLVADIERTEDDRKKWSRRRATHSGDTVDFINGRNEHFNKKIKRAYDKYTVEIRQNIERGTAL
jgi:hypothetical protein